MPTAADCESVRGFAVAGNPGSRYHGEELFAVSCIQAELMKSAQTRFLARTVSQWMTGLGDSLNPVWGRLDSVPAAARLFYLVGQYLYRFAGKIDSHIDAPEPDGPPTKTLFNPDIRQYVKDPMPYPLAVSCLYNNGSGFHEDELCAFSDLTEWELALYGRGYIAGPLVFRADELGIVDAAQEAADIPYWVEEDGLDLVQCDADKIIITSNANVFRALVKARAWEPLQAILVTGIGIPRPPTRRLLHRLSLRFGIPVFVLEDNDTWGYFIYSLLKRGTMNPADRCRYFATEDVRYLGLRAGDGSSACRRRWEPRFDLRLSYLKHYECFASSEWQVELEHFKKLNRAVDLGAYVQELGARCFVDKHMLPNLESGNCLS